MVLVVQLIAVLNAGSRVSCHNFLNLCLCFNRTSAPGRSLLKSESVTLLVDTPKTEDVEAVKSRVALSAFTPELILGSRGHYIRVKALKPLRISVCRVHVIFRWRLLFTYAAF
jgi:hypothetical protein